MAVIFSCGHNAVVANFAILGNARVIITAVRLQFQKTSGIVTVITFGIGRNMFVGFANGPHTVMTFTAFAKYF